MNLYALEGHKVWCSTFDAGYEYQRKLVEEHLELYKEYTVERTSVGSWSTEVWLKEVPGIVFNSVFFEDVAEQPLEKTRQHSDYQMFNRLMKPIEFSEKVVPTYESYMEAKKIVDLYMEEVTRLHDLKVEEFRIALREYFDNNLIDGLFKLEEFEFRKGNFGSNEIIPLKPSMEENYEGGNDEDIEELCKKYGVNFKIIYWCYHK